MQKLVVISGSGISQESGIPTFRDMGGLWEKYDFTELASPQAWKKNPDLVLKFYNSRRKAVIEAEPNFAHYSLAKLEKKYDVHIITQNVDDLHERAGSTKILHLHGEIRKARSTYNQSYVCDIKAYELKLGDLCPEGYQLRPHIVWFGEAVETIPFAINIVKQADILLIIGTSLQVYPAAGLVDYASRTSKKYIIDPSDHFHNVQDFIHLKETAVNGMHKLITDFV